MRNVIRITHDKILVDPDLIEAALQDHYEKEADYTYLTGPTSGIGFEIIKASCLERAYRLSRSEVEHISYPVRKAAKNPNPFQQPKEYQTNARLLIDYPEDLTFFDTLFSIKGVDVSALDAIGYINNAPDGIWRALNGVNALPDLTVYTCAYNAAPYVAACVKSVNDQAASFPGQIEYVFVDDASTDNTLESAIAAYYSLPNYGNLSFRWCKNLKNEGLGASSNKALSMARGRYIMRIDADDYFFSKNSTTNLYKYALEQKQDVIYSACMTLGEGSTIQKPQERHHIGGAIFNKSALNYLKFNDQFKGYEGAEFFLRCQNDMQIGYYEKEPVFYYVQREGSLSRTNMKYRRMLHGED